MKLVELGFQPRCVAHKSVLLNTMLCGLSTVSKGGVFCLEYDWTGGPRISLTS